MDDKQDYNYDKSYTQHPFPMGQSIGKERLYISQDSINSRNELIDKLNALSKKKEFEDEIINYRRAGRTSYTEYKLDEILLQHLKEHEYLSYLYVISIRKINGFLRKIRNIFSKFICKD